MDVVELAVVGVVLVGVVGSLEGWCAGGGGAGIGEVLPDLEVEVRRRGPRCRPILGVRTRSRVVVVVVAGALPADAFDCDVFVRQLPAFPVLPATRTIRVAVGLDAFLSFLAPDEGTRIEGCYCRAVKWA